MISFCYFKKKKKKIELYFGCDPCWPRFCPNRVIEEQFLTSFPFFFFFFQNYNMITQYVPTYLTKNQQKKSTVGGIKG